MAVVVRNTFLDVADHKFLCFDEPCGAAKRCHSVPRTWKPVTPLNRSTKRTLSMSSSSSTQSEVSFCSTMDSFEALSASEDNSDCYSLASGGDATEMEANIVSKTVSDDTANVSGKDNNTTADIAGTWTRLKGESPAFQPVPTDTRLDAVANAVYLALVSCGQTCHVKIEKGLQGTSPTLISAELQSGPRSSSRCYDTIHLARQALDEITTRLNTVALLSKRVQKEDRGYSLRSSIACIPSGAEDNMCWDLFHKGYCPRRCKCQWYHPQESDIGRVKVNIRCTEEVIGVSSEEQLPASFPVVRHKISLGELVQ